MDPLFQYKFLICIALDQECPDLSKYDCMDKCSLKAVLAGDYRNLSNKCSVLVIITGVGKENAIKAATWANHHLDLDFVLNIGSAGSNSTNIELGTLIKPRYTFSNDDSNKTPITTSFFDESSISFKEIDGCYSLSSLSDESTMSGDIIDMEAHFLAQAFQSYQTAFCVIKYVSDYNDSNKNKDFQDSLSKIRSSFQLLFDQCFLAPEIEGVSVIIPTYNRAKFIKESVQSVLYQTTTDIPVECIVIDDGSDDDTSEVLEKFNKSITYIKQNKNKGVSYARNLGVRNSTYNWLAFLDSDDIWEGDKLVNQIAYLKRYPYYKIVQSDEKWLRSAKIITKKPHWKKKSGFIFSDCLKRCMISPSSLFISKDIFIKAQCFDEDFLACEDYDLWLRLSRHFLIGCVPEELITKVAGHHDQLSSKSCLDFLRVKALAKALNAELHPYNKCLIKNEIEHKLMILINGAKKRCLDTGLYEKYLSKLKSNDFEYKTLASQ